MWAVITKACGDGLQWLQNRFVGMRRTKSLGGGAAIRRVAHMTLCPPSPFGSSKQNIQIE
jgi:hypothetical protein